MDNSTHKSDIDQEPAAQVPINPQNRIMAVTGNQYDGNIIINLSNDGMEARADFLPPIGTGKSLTKEYVLAFLKRLNIHYGIQWDIIQEAMTGCNLDKRTIRDVLVAKGKPPVDGIAEHYELNPRLVPVSLPQNTDARLDYHAYSPFIIVKQDQALAWLKPREIGKEGSTIYGTAIPYKTIQPPLITGGEHTRIDGTYIIAEINGQFIQRQGILNVQDVLVIKGGVGYATGNIIFPGDVIINGPVSGGFKIFSGGSVTIKETFDVTEVITKMDLTVSGGIIGRSQAVIKVGGAIRTKFIENCRVASMKTIVAQKEIINSRVFSMDTIDMGDKGRIIGSDMYAVHGIRAGGIGKGMGKSTRIHCGIDFIAQQEKEKCNNRLRVVAIKLEKLRKFIAAPETAEETRVKMMALCRRLEEEQQQTEIRVSDLLGRIIVDEKATVEVSGEIASGTLIEICQIALFVAEPLRRVRIKLDKENEKLRSEPL
ncbi:MAG: FapA family protein [Treponema sp.]|jgi:uncharacterized protein (DUF342 family)|nr:FapA family protein [Treponema sp.]